MILMKANYIDQKNVIVVNLVRSLRKIPWSRVRLLLLIVFYLENLYSIAIVSTKKVSTHKLKSINQNVSARQLKSIY